MYALNAYILSKFTHLYLILRGKDRNQLYLKQSCIPSCFLNTSDLQVS